MKKTQNYKLNKIELTDSPPDITVLNTNFDIIDGELKKAESWEEFKKNGGTIGGPIATNRIERIIPVNAIEDGYAAALALKSANGLDKLELLLGQDSGKRALYPIQGFGLGTPNFAFSEAWFGDFLKSANGYLPLGNGFILQAGRINVTVNGQTAEMDFNFPIAFPNNIIAVVSGMNVIANRVSANIYSRNLSTCHLRVFSTTEFTLNGTYPVNYIAIGY